MTMSAPDLATKPLSGRVVAVTGASRGIGRAIAQQLCAAGARVLAGARRAAAEGIEAIEAIEEMVLDVREEDSVAAFARRAAERDVDSLVHNAGVGMFGPIESASVDDYRLVFDTNVLGMLQLARHFNPQFRRRHALGRVSHLVAVTSDVSTRTVSHGALYTASKHAQRALCQVAAREGQAYGLRVTEVRPGMTDTWFNGNTPGRPERAAHLRADDVAQAVLFALSAPPHARVDEIVLHPAVQAVET